MSVGCPTCFGECTKSLTLHHYWTRTRFWTVGFPGNSQSWTSIRASITISFSPTTCRACQRAQALRTTLSSSCLPVSGFVVFGPSFELSFAAQSLADRACRKLPTMSSLKTGLSITGLLVFGTTTSLFAKIGETVTCPGVSLLCLCACDPDQLHSIPRSLVCNASRLPARQQQTCRVCSK